MPLHIYISQFTFRIGPRKIQDGIVPAQFNREVSIHALPNRNSPSEFAEEVHNLVLSPIPVVATVLAILHSGAGFRGLAYEGAVPAVDCLDESNVRVRINLLTRLGRDANEGIVCRGYNNRRPRDPIAYVRRRSAIVIVVYAGEAAVERCNPVIEFAEAADAAQAAEIEVAGEKSRFLCHAAAKRPQEIFFVDAIGGLVQRIG